MAVRPTTKRKTKSQAGDPRASFRCGPVTESSIAKAAEDKRLKTGTFLRVQMEEWLQLNGYDVDPV